MDSVLFRTTPTVKNLQYQLKNILSLSQLQMKKSYEQCLRFLPVPWTITSFIASQCLLSPIDCMNRYRPEIPLFWLNGINQRRNIEYNWCTRCNLKRHSLYLWLQIDKAYFDKVAVWVCVTYCNKIDYTAVCINILIAARCYSFQIRYILTRLSFVHMILLRHRVVKYW